MLRATDDDTVIEQRVRTILERIRQGGSSALAAVKLYVSSSYRGLGGNRRSDNEIYCG